VSGDPVADYVAELRRLLRTSPQRRRRIAHEIEDHLREAFWANESLSLKDLQDRFGTTEDLAEQFNTLASTSGKTHLTRVAACAALATACALVLPVRLTRAPHQRAQAIGSEVMVDPHSGAVVLTTQPNLVRIDPATGRRLTAGVHINH
jgi:hypothetical protein